MAKKKKSKKSSSSKKKFSFFSTLLTILCICVIAFSGWKLYGYIKGYKEGSDEYEELRSYVEEDTESEGTTGDGENKDTCPIKVDFDTLKKINPDVVGWIYIKGSGINYPIVHAKEKGNDYYLHHTFEDKSNFSGAIFLDELCESDFSMDNSVIYGHNLKNGEMFGHLKKMYDTNYNEDADYSKYPVVWILTPDKKMEYAVFAGREIDADKDEDAYTIEFASGAEYQSFLETSKEKSLFKTDVDVLEGLTLRPSITLSTCTSTTESGRFIVQAIQIQELDSN